MVLTGYKRISSFFLLLICLLGFGTISKAEDTIDVQIKYPYSYLKTDYKIKIDKNWTHQGKSLDIPFSFDENEQARLSNQFYLNDSVPQQLYLYIERASWHVEVELNGKYLDIHQKPYKPFIIALEGSWLKKGTNALELNLLKGESCYLCPRQTLGIYEPVYILTSAQLAKIQKSFMQEVTTADSVALVAPFYRKDGYSFNSFEAARTILPIIKDSSKYIYFPFEPDRRLEALCAQYGFIRVREINEETYIGPVNFYPVESSEFPWTFTFWIDGNGRRNHDYGNYYKGDDYLSNVDSSTSRGIIVLMLFFPLLVFVFVKLIGPSFFYSQRGLLFNPKLYVDSSLSTSETQTGWILMLQIFRLAGLSIFITLAIYYIRLTHQWELINFFRSPSLLQDIFYGDYSLPGLFFRSFSIVSIWFMVKHFLIMVVGSAFGVKGMLEGAMNLDIVGSYPLIILLPIPAGLLLLWGGDHSTIMLIILLISGGIYLIRKLYVLFLGLNRLFGFPTSMKFLYICTFNIFPYVFWL